MNSKKIRNLLKKTVEMWKCTDVKEYETVLNHETSPFYALRRKTSKTFMKSCMHRAIGFVV